MMLFNGCQNPRDWFYSRYLDPVNYYIVGSSKSARSFENSLLKLKTGKEISRVPLR